MTNEAIFYEQTKTVLTEYCAVMRPYLPSLNKTPYEHKQQVLAFDMLERIFYNTKGAAILFDEFGYNHNMSLPLTQIFRTLVYDISISYWLFKQGYFEDRLLLLNTDYIRKNGNRIKDREGAERLQNVSYKRWMEVAPENFTKDGDQLVPISKRMPTFDEISKGLMEENKVDRLFASLHVLYIAFSQQAHVSSFSKELTYYEQQSIKKAFCSASHAIIKGSIMLLNIICLGDYQSVIDNLDQLGSKVFTNK